MTDIEPKDEEGTTELEDEELEDVAAGVPYEQSVEPYGENLMRENC